MGKIFSIELRVDGHYCRTAVDYGQGNQYALVTGFSYNTHYLVRTDSLSGESFG
jgi:hypothetical protein